MFVGRKRAEAKKKKLGKSKSTDTEEEEGDDDQDDGELYFSLSINLRWFFLINPSRKRKLIFSTSVSQPFSNILYTIRVTVIINSLLRIIN